MIKADINESYWMEQKGEMDRRYQVLIRAQGTFLIIKPFSLDLSLYSSDFEILCSHLMLFYVYVK